MPKGPQGQKRPADAIGCAVMVGRIATGEVEDDDAIISPVKSGRGKAGGRARAINLPPERKKEIARAGASTRWSAR